MMSSVTYSNLGSKRNSRSNEMRFSPPSAPSIFFRDTFTLYEEGSFSATVNST